MSRILLTTIGSLGDLHPKIALGLELRKRGHDIIFAIHKEYHPKVEALDFKCYHLRPDETSPNDFEMMKRVMDLKTGTEVIMREVIMNNLRDTYADVMNAVQDVDFIVVGEVVYPAGLVAEKLSIKWAFCALSPSSFFSVYDPPVIPVLPSLAKLRVFGPFVNQGVRTFVTWASNSWVEPYYKFREELGLPPTKNPIMGGKYSPYLVLSLFSPVLAAPQPDWPKNMVVTGFTFYDGEQKLKPELQDFLDTGEAPIVFTLGSAAVLVPGDFYQENIQATQALKRRAVLLIGKNTPPENLPANIIAVDYAPYSEIFPRACAIVHQGGIGTTAQALKSGHPTIVVPYSHDQPDNAARVERLGTSRTISRKHYTAKRVTKELSKLLNNQSYSLKAAAIGKIIQKEDGVKLACDAIEKLLRDKSK